MKKQTLRNFALALSLLALALIPSASLAQVGLASRLGAGVRQLLRRKWQAIRRSRPAHRT